MSEVTTAWRFMGCAVVVALVACHSAPTRIYNLDSAVPAARMDDYQAPALRVDAVSVPASWDRIEILTVSAAGSLEINDLDHWSASLAQIARLTLSDDLDQRLPPGSVIYPRLPKPDGALSIDVDILEFTLTASHASMHASWLVVPAAGSQGARRSVISLQGTLASTEPTAVARAWSELIGQLADRIAADAASFKTP
jgi:uncharacterized protein